MILAVVRSPVAAATGSVAKTVVLIQHRLQYHLLITDTTHIFHLLPFLRAVQFSPDSYVRLCSPPLCQNGLETVRNCNIFLALWLLIPT